MMKQIFCLLAASALLLSLSGCDAKAKANSTYTGTVSAISEKGITLATDEGEVTISITENTRMTMGGFGGFGQMGQMPEGDWTRPADGERPEGDFSMPDFEGREMPEFGQFPEGQMPEGMERPEGGSFEGFGGGFGGMAITSIPVGTTVTVVTGADKTAATISMAMNFQNFGGEMPNFQN